MRVLKTTKLLIVCLVVMVFSGCMVQRLLAFKKQMNQAGKYVNFYQDGIITFSKPVLHLSDIKLLTGVHPTAIFDDEVIYEFNRPDAPSLSLTYRLIFIENKLKAIDYPDQFFNIIPSVFAINSLQVFGQSELPKDKNPWKLNSNIPKSLLPTRKDIITMLGKPTHIQSFPTVEHLIYKYKHPTQTNSQFVSIIFIISKLNHRIKQGILNLPDRQWDMSF